MLGMMAASIGMVLLIVASFGPAAVSSAAGASLNATVAMETSLAAALEAAAVPADGERGADYSVRAKLILDAALAVFEALRFLAIDLVWEAALWLLAHPILKRTLYTALVVVLLYQVLRVRVRREWEGGLKRSKITRTGPEPTKTTLQLDNDTEMSDGFTEDEGLGGASKMKRLETGDAPPGEPRHSVAAQCLSRLGETQQPASRSGGPEQASTLAAPTPQKLLRNCRALIDDMDDDCVRFLEQRLETATYAAGEVIFEAGTRREGFFIIRSGKVLVDTYTATAANDARDKNGADAPGYHAYTLGAGETVVGLLFVLASLEAGDGAPEPPAECRYHTSTARAGPQGAEVISLPHKALAEFFAAYPDRLLPMVQRLCVRLGLVVLDALSTYFGLRSEVIGTTAYTAVPDFNQDEAQPPAELFARALGYRGQPGEDVRAALAEATTIEIEAGHYAVPPKQRTGRLLILLDGDLRLMVTRGGKVKKRGTTDSTLSELEEESQRVPCGHIVGELSVLVDGPSPVVHFCRTKCRFAVLPRDAVLKVLALQPQRCCLRLLHLASARCATWLHRVDAALDWLPVEGGRCLFRKGDRMVGFFVVLSGRLLSLEAHDQSKGPGAVTPEGQESTMPQGKKSWRVDDVFQRGRLVGELDCLRERPYSSTVHAARDTEVCRISPSLLHLIAHHFPKAILHFSSYVGAPKSDQAVLSGSSPKRRVTITVVPASSDVKVHDVCARLTSALNHLGKTLHIEPRSDLTSARGGGGAAQHRNATTGLSSLAGSRLARVLADLEERCRWVVYEAEPGWTDWTQRCVRQADHILVASNFDGSSRGDVPPTILERHVASALPLYVDVELLLIHESSAKTGAADDWIRQADLLRPSVNSFFAHQTNLFLGSASNKAQRSTRHYLNKRPWAQRWHHVRPLEGSDWGRCARLLAGSAVGVCLGGGGARGNVHFGLIKALTELGIPVDVVSGTSFGALAGGLYCLCAPSPESLFPKVKRTFEQHFSISKMLMDFTFPRTSYLTGAYLNRLLQMTFARRRCEDLLVPFACTSCDIAQFEGRVHTLGPLWRVIRASMSLVGLVPPLPFQERTKDGKTVNSLLIDGGYVNQYPIEVLKEHGAGLVICNVACPDFNSICMDYGDTVVGGMVVLRRWLSCCRRRQTVEDPPSVAEIQERLMNLVEYMKESNQTRSDLLITSPITPYGLLDFHKYQEIMDVGYAEAKPRLEEFLNSGSKEALRLKEIIEMNKANIGSVTHIQGNEYGPRRRAVRLWRKVKTTAARGATTAAGQLSKQAGVTARKISSQADKLSKTADKLLPRRRPVFFKGQSQSDGEQRDSDGLARQSSVDEGPPTAPTSPSNAPKSFICRGSSLSVDNVDSS
eukprot:TRINITY_DN74564_c0_g1_i1.p1 TRINITY_DN74564_c0_g1~~TRINITY_DN74564_c0_g1_i1.p1  ORF type:complete len:1373 (+),score=275.83 TRINITY_DN74564_c0_g1_i1:161-4279(+)